MNWLATETSESLDRIHFCKSCGRAFLFKADKDDHSLQTGHRVFIIFTLEGKLFESD